VSGWRAGPLTNRRELKGRRRGMHSAVNSRAILYLAAPEPGRLPVIRAPHNHWGGAQTLPVHSLRTVLNDLSGIVPNQPRLPGHTENLISVVTDPDPEAGFSMDLGRPEPVCSQMIIRLTSAL